MTNTSNLFYLSKDESLLIDSWLKSKNFSLKDGYFILEFEFSPYGDKVLFSFKSSFYSDCITLYDDWNRDIGNRDIDVLNIDGMHVNLSLSNNVMEEYFRLGQEYVNAHLDADCEPCGFGLSIEIHENCCKLIAGNTLISNL